MLSLEVSDSVCSGYSRGDEASDDDVGDGENFGLDPGPEDGVAAHEYFAGLDIGDFGEGTFC
jgi:hypothetical protein